MKHGIDLSHWNRVTNWDKIRADFIIIKCTESTSYVDPTYLERKKEIIKRGINFGAYHFARGGDVRKEADWFLYNIGVTDRSDILVLDWEINHTNPSKWCKDFLDYIKQKTGITPYLYTNEARANQIQNSFPWWIARYGTNNGKQQTPPTKDWTIWQYTSRGGVSGIDGYVDMNVMKDENQSEEPIEIKNYTPYSQKNFKWIWKKVGFGNQYFGSVGCFVTCLAMMCGKRPDEVNEILKKNGGFSGNLIKSKEAAKALGLEFNGKETDINKMPMYSPSIKEVNYNRNSKTFSQHFVLRIIKPDGSRAIIDPLGGVERAINYYPFKSYRLFKNK